MTTYIFHDLDPILKRLVQLADDAEDEDDERDQDGDGDSERDGDDDFCRRAEFASVTICPLHVKEARRAVRRARVPDRGSAVSWSSLGLRIRVLEAVGAGHGELIESELKRLYQ